MAPDSSVTGRRPAGPLLAAAVLRATWLDAAGHPEAAARVWTRLSARTGLWQAGLRGVQSFLAVLDAEPLPGAPTPKPAAEGAGLAFGLAQSLRKTVRTPALHRLATVAATRSRWSRVAGSERDNGTEGLKVPRTPTMPTPNASPAPSASGCAVGAPGTASASSTARNDWTPRSPACHIPVLADSRVHTRAAASGRPAASSQVARSTAAASSGPAGRRPVTDESGAMVPTATFDLFFETGLRDLSLGTSSSAASSRPACSSWPSAGSSSASTGRADAGRAGAGAGPRGREDRGRGPGLAGAADRHRAARRDR